MRNLLRFLIITAISAADSFAAARALVAEHQKVKWLETAQQVRELSREEAQKKIPVRITGVVTFVDPDWGMLWVQDKTAGVFVFLRTSTTRSVLKTGSLVNVQAVTTPGDFSPCLTEGHIEIIGSATLPEPGRFLFEHLITGEEDAQQVEIQGIARSSRISKGHLVLSVQMAGGRTTVTLPHYPPDWQSRFVDARILARGTMGTRFNTHRQIIGLNLFVPGSEFIRILDKPPDDPFSLPAIRVSNLGRFFAHRSWDHRVRLRVVATAVEEDGTFFASDHAGDNVYIRTHESCSPRPGDLVDAVGFSATENRPTLDEAICRVVDAGHGDTRRPVDAMDFFEHDEKVESPYDMALIRTDGYLIETTNGPRSNTLVLKNGNEIFSAVLPMRKGAGAEPLAPGTHVGVTGVFVTVFNNFQQAVSFRLLLRSPADVQVLSRPPWWSLRAALWAAALMALACLAAFAWVLVLRHQVSSKTRAVRLANAALERLSGLDPLTGVANRRRFDESLAAELRNAAKSGTPVSLLMIDIDYFKEVNDNLGHRKGDECLVEVARALRVAADSTHALVARYGGEEFAVIAPHTGNSDAAAFGERIRCAIQLLRIPHPSARGGGFLTVSIGSATCLPRALTQATPEVLVEAADRALYTAKRSGRNIMVATESITDPVGFSLLPRRN